MRRISTVYTWACVALAAFAFQGCRTENLDANNIITKPYTLYFADSNGVIYHTNDGERISVKRGPDGVEIGTLETAGNNLLMCYTNGTILHVAEVSKYTNVNFNQSFIAVHPLSFGQSRVLNANKFADGVKNRVYVAGAGVYYNDSNGTDGSRWLKDESDPIKNANVNSITSYARLDNGKVIGYDDVSRRLISKADASAPWIVHPGSGLPGAGSGRLAIINKGNDIIAYAYGNDPAARGFWRSTDDGQTFAALPQLPDTPFITAATGTFGKVLIACTRDRGIFRLSGDQDKWEYSSFGLDAGTRVYAIVAKDNMYKNDAEKVFVFIATSTGIYRSDDQGQNWIKIFQSSDPRGAMTAIQ